MEFDKPTLLYDHDGLWYVIKSKGYGSIVQLLDYYQEKTSKRLLPDVYKGSVSRDYPNHPPYHVIAYLTGCELMPLRRTHVRYDDFIAIRDADEVIIKTAYKLDTILNL